MPIPNQKKQKVVTQGKLAISKELAKHSFPSGTQSEVIELGSLDRFQIVGLGCNDDKLSEQDDVEGVGANHSEPGYRTL